MLLKSTISSLLLASTLLLLTGAAQAQGRFSIGPRLGLNVSTYHFTESTPAQSVKYRPGVEAGLMANIGLGGHLAVQPSLLYSQKGFTESTSVDVRTGTNLPVGSGELEYRNRLNYLSLPINMAYSQRADGQGFQVFAGPYVGLLLSGKYESTIKVAGNSTTEGGKITPVSGDAPEYGAFAHRFDAGLQGGIGYRYSALLLQLDYSLGLREVPARYAYSNSTYYNRTFQLALSYLVGPNK